MKEIIRFLKDNIFGKTLYTNELTYTLEGNTLEGVYCDEIIFGNPVRSDFGFSFDLFMVANETIYEIGNEGERLKVRSDQNGVSVFRYELAERKSTGEVTGSFRLLTTTNINQMAQAIVCGVFGVQLKDNELCWMEEQILYRDQCAGDDGYRPVAFDSENRFYFEEGKVVFEYDGTSYDVDPNTLSRILSKDMFPKFIARER